MDPLTSVIVGGVTAVGGGIVRDVLAGQVPEVLRREMYALPACSGSVLDRDRPPLRRPHPRGHLGLRGPGVRGADDRRRPRCPRPQAPANRRTHVSTPTPIPDDATPDTTAGDAEVSPLDPYDGILLLSFGGPEKPEDVLPFLRTVTAGKNIPDERLEEVGEHYYGFGGRSPINDQNRALIAALRAELDRRQISTPVIWGNRNFTPFCTRRSRRPTAGAVAPRHGDDQRVLVLLLLPPVPRGPRRCHGEGGRGRHRHRRRQDPHLRQPPRLLAARTAGSSPRPCARCCEVERTRRPRLLFVTHSIPTAMDDDVRTRRRGRQRLQPPAHRAWARRSPTR